MAIVSVIIAVAMALLAIPILSLIFSALKGDDGPTIQNFISVTEHPQFWPAMRNTAISGVGTVIVMTFITVPLAWIYTRTNLPRKNLMIALITINVAIPSFLVALGYIFVFNPSNGVFNEIWRGLFNAGASPVNVYSLGWIVFLQGVALSAPAFFMTVPTLQGIDTSLEEAAAANGVRRWKAALFIVLPLASPAIFAVAAYYFIIAVEMFDYAGMLGTPARTYVAASLLYAFIHDEALPRYSEAASLGLIMAVMAMFLAFAYLWAVRNADRFVVLTGKRKEQISIQLSRSGKRWAWGFVALYFTIGTGMPLLMLLWASGLPFLQVPSFAAMKLWNLNAYANVLPMVPLLLKNNLLLILVVPTIGVILAACLAWAGTRLKSKLRKGIDITVMLAVAVPSIVGALGFLAFGLMANSYIAIYGTIWLIAITMAARYLTWANRTIATSMMQIHPEIEEAALVSGVRKGRTFLSIVLPNVARSLLISWFWLALLSLRDLTIPIMLSRRGTDVFSTAIWGLNSSGITDEAAALSVILAVLILIFVGCYHLISTKWVVQK
ncbi:ABC transporter permease [Pseudorhodobacter sp. W20_MBD10_FR17]|uniref:ABC transporter permease n=1 Tax=Pseudorhodobacter sp. W20_MBD10_FR17 TaxID=3240266 RepID=UPI003F9B5D95